MKKKNKREVIGTITERDYVRAQRKASREEEIALHGRPVAARRMVHRNRKAYSRKRSGWLPEDDR